MDNRPSQDLPLDQYLVAINSSDFDGKWIVPKADVRDRLAKEIEQRTGVERGSLMLEEREGIENWDRWVSAKPGDFIKETQSQLDSICTRLSLRGATRFEIVFSNLKLPQYQSGERVTFNVRFLIPDPAS